MKRIALVAMLCAAAIAIGAQAAPAGKSAKGQGQQGQQGQALAALKSSTLSGVLAFSGEDPAVKTEAETVVLDMPKFYYYAYTDGLKAGMAVKVKGFLMKARDSEADEASRLVVTEMTINGKTYVVPVGPVQGHGRMGGPGGAGGMPESPRGESAPSGNR